MLQNKYFLKNENVNYFDGFLKKKVNTYDILNLEDTKKDVIQS